MIQVDRAIKQIKFVGMHVDPDSDTGKAYDLAIRSLEAWKKVEKRNLQETALRSFLRGCTYWPSNG